MELLKDGVDVIISFNGERVIIDAVMWEDEEWE